VKTIVTRTNEETWRLRLMALDDHTDLVTGQTGLDDAAVDRTEVALPWFPHTRIHTSPEIWVPVPVPVQVLTLFLSWVQCDVRFCSRWVPLCVGTFLLSVELAVRSPGVRVFCVDLSRKQ